jgi:hypothetical protein
VSRSRSAKAATRRLLAAEDAKVLALASADLILRLHWFNQDFRADVLAYLRIFCPSLHRRLGGKPPSHPLRDFGIERAAPEHRPPRRPSAKQQALLGNEIGRLRERWPHLDPAYWGGRTAAVLGGRFAERPVVFANPSLWPEDRKAPNAAGWRRSVMDDFDRIFPAALCFIPVYADSIRAELIEAVDAALALIGERNSRRRRGRDTLEWQVRLTELYGDAEESTRSWEKVLLALSEERFPVATDVVACIRCKHELAAKGLRGKDLEFELHEMHAQVIDLALAEVARCRKAKSRVLQLSRALGPADQLAVT